MPDTLDAANKLVRNVLVANVVRYERPADGEFDIPDIEQFVDDGFKAHDPNKEYVEIPAAEEPLVVLLARINLARARVARILGSEFSHSAAGGSADATSPAGLLLQHIAALEKQYMDISQALGVGLGGSMPAVLQSELVRSDRVLDRLVPTDTQPAPPKVFLAKYKEPTSGTAWLEWTESNISDLYEYRLYRHSSAGLEDLTTLTETSPTHAGITAAATLVTTIRHRWKTYYKDSVSAGTYYYVLVVVDESGKISVSNEIEIEVP